MTSKEIIATLAKFNPDAKIWTDCHPALIGIAARPGQRPVAVYSMEGLVAGLMETKGLSNREASHIVDELFLKGDFGKGAPVILIETFSKDYQIGLGKAKPGGGEKSELAVLEEKKIILPGEPN